MNLHSGHRQRMYDRLAKDALSEHEWLEVLLFYMLPRKNTNNIAHELIKRFGSVEEAIAAPIEQLVTVPGVGMQVAAHLKCIEHFYQHYKKDTSGDFTGVFTPKSFLPYVKQNYASLAYEVVDLYLLDGESRVMKKQGFSIESISTVRMVPEEVSMFLLTKDVHGVVMVHNHPRGRAVPSDYDDVMTKNIQMVCSMHNRLFCDHCIYAPDGVYSYYLSGRLAHISKNFSMDQLMEDVEE